MVGLFISFIAEGTDVEYSDGQTRWLLASDNLGGWYMDYQGVVPQVGHLDFHHLEVLLLSLCVISA